MSYSRLTFINDGPPARNATNYNHSEEGIQEASDRLDALDAARLYDAARSGVTADGTTNDRAAVVAAITAAASTGSALQLPPGTINNAGAAIELAAGVRVVGCGRTATRWTGPGFILTDSNEVSGIGFDGTTASTSAAVATKTDVQHFDGYVHDCDFQNYGTYAVRLAGSADNFGATRMTIEDCTFADNAVAVLAERVYECRIEGCTSVNAAATGRHFVFYGGAGNQILGNTTVGGITGVLFLYSRSIIGPAGKIRGNIVQGNRIVTPSEEGISFDCHGNTAAEVAAIDYGTVSSTSYNSGVPQLAVTLDSAFTTAGTGFYGYDVLFLSGALAGQAFTIDGHSNRVLSLNRFDPSQSTAVTAGDAVVIGAAAVGNSIVGNSVDLAGTYGIVLWGMAAGNTVVGNTVRGTRSGSTVTGTIALVSQDGLVVATDNKSGRAGVAPVTGNVVSANTLTDTNLVFSIVLYGGATGYTTLKNKSAGNVVCNGAQVVTSHTLATF